MEGEALYKLFHDTKGEIQNGGGKEVTKEIGVGKCVGDHYVS